MSFIRTVDADGNPIAPEPKIRRKRKQTRETIEPMTWEQADALNAFLAKAEREKMTFNDTLIGARNLMRRQKINDGIKKRVLTYMVKTEYLDPNKDFTKKQAAAALNILLGTPKQAAAEVVEAWKTGETGKTATNADYTTEEQEYSDNGSSEPGQY